MYIGRGRKLTAGHYTSDAIIRPKPAKRWGLEMRAPITALILSVLVGPEFAYARALTFEDIHGKWCTGGGILQFEDRTLTAVRSSDGNRSVYTVTRYEFTETTIKVHWLLPNKPEAVLIYEDFSSDGRKMSQSNTEVRRVFYRC